MSRRPINAGAGMTRVLAWVDGANRADDGRGRMEWPAFMILRIQTGFDPL